MAHKLGLLIQGPLLSIGRGAKKYELAQGEIGEIINYDCTKSIEKNLNNYGDLFEEIIISTWSDEQLSKGLKKLVSQFNNLKFIQLDKSPHTRLEQRQYGNFTWNNNQLLQYDGCYKGLLEFETSDFIIRIRTDQEVDIKELIEDSLKNVDLITVPAIHEAREYFAMEDFYFSGQLGLLKNFCKVASERSYHSAPQISPIFALASLKFFNQIKDKESLIKFWSNSFTHRLLAFQIVTKYLKPARKSIFMNLTWRGQKATKHWATIHDYKFFKEDLPIDKRVTLFTKHQTQLDSFFHSIQVNILHKILRKLSLVIINLFQKV